MNMIIVSIVSSLIVSLFSVDNICTFIAKAIARILSWASKKGGKSWDIAKAAILKINVWTSLFLQVYEDDELTADDEKLIAEAIKKETDITKLIDILKSKTAKKAK